MVEPAPITQPLDEYLTAVVETLHTAVNQGYKHATDNPALTEKAAQDCAEILDVIMAGNVEEWVQ